MANLKTEHVTTHTVTLTDRELHALRVAADIALAANASTTPDQEQAWMAFSKLGKPATRSTPETFFHPADRD